MKYCGQMILTLFALFLSISLYAVETQREFTPQHGFGGHSQGDGSLRLFFGKQRAFHVDSHGYQQVDGTFRLDQTVTFQGQKPQKRHWILKTTSSNQYKGTLSDASGIVRGQTNGLRLTLRYRIKGPMFMHQTLKLLPDGKTIDNVGKITLIGIPIGSLHETIIMNN